MKRKAMGLIMAVMLTAGLLSGCGILRSGRLADKKSIRSRVWKQY